jgi:hypothetical protein
MAELTWDDFVAAHALVTIGNYVANIEEPATTDAVDIATTIAKEHNHTTFLWTVADINAKAAPAAAAAAAAVSAVVAAASPKRKEMYTAATTSANRPVAVGGNLVQIGATSYHTRSGATVMALWDVTHPAAPLLALFKAEQLERSDASALYTFMAKTLNADNIASRAATVARAVATLVKVSNPKA